MTPRGGRWVEIVPGRMLAYVYSGQEVRDAAGLVRKGATCWRWRTHTREGTASSLEEAQRAVAVDVAGAAP